MLPTQNLHLLLRLEATAMNTAMFTTMSNHYNFYCNNFYNFCFKAVLATKCSIIVMSDTTLLSPAKVLLQHHTDLGDKLHSNQRLKTTKMASAVSRIVIIVIASLLGFCFHADDDSNP